MLKEKLSYKSTVLIIQDKFVDFDKVVSIITSNTKFRVLNSSQLCDANIDTKRKRIDLILLNSSLFNVASKNKKNIIELKKLTELHSSAIFLIFFKAKINQKTNLDNFFNIIPNFIPVNNPINEKMFLINLSNANFFSKVNNDNKSNTLKLQNLFSENKKMLNRLEKFAEKENERASVYKKYRNNTMSSFNADSMFKNEELKEIENKTKGKIKSDNDKILEELSKLFKKLNKLNEVEKISFELEQKVPNILNINKFSIFLIGNEFKDLKHFTSSNFNGIKNNKLSIDEIFEKSVMFDTIFKREVIYLKNYKNSKFSLIPEKDNNYLKYSNTDCLCIPLMSGNKIIGVGNFNDSKFGFFSKNQLNHISMFANYVAILLDNILPQIENK